LAVAVAPANAVHTHADGAKRSVEHGPSHPLSRRPSSGQGKMPEGFALVMKLDC
jgi:hypothetical protein